MRILISFLFAFAVALAAKGQAIEFMTPAEAEAQLTVVENEEKESVSLVLTADFFNRYLGANGDIFYDGVVGQPSLTALFGNGVYLNGWMSGCGDAWWSNFCSEVDGTVGFAKGDWDFSVGHFWLVRDAGSDVVQLKVVHRLWSFERGANGFVVDTKAEYYFPTSSDGPAEGTILRLGLSYSRPLGDRWSLNQRAGVFYDTGAFGYQRGFLAEWNGSVAFKWRGVSVGPVVKFSTPLGMDHDSDGAIRSTQWAFGLTMSKNF